MFVTPGALSSARCGRLVVAGQAGVRGVFANSRAGWQLPVEDSHPHVQVAVCITAGRGSGQEVYAF